MLFLQTEKHLQYHLVNRDIEPKPSNSCLASPICPAQQTAEPVDVVGLRIQFLIHAPTKRIRCLELI
ncbi:hypothetical protein, partial [Salmonella enterica]|uniref:hypothetical protein n=1 Tax=Salmonella enterica TaxID=28901 RepID=UPI001C376E11